MLFNSLDYVMKRLLIVKVIRVAEDRAPEEVLERGERPGGIGVGCENSPRRCWLPGFVKRGADKDTASEVDSVCFARLVGR